MNTVVREIDRVLDGGDRRPGGSSRGPAGAGHPPSAPSGANERRITSGPSDEPPIPSNTASVKPSAADLVGKGPQLSDVTAHALGQGQPAQAVLDLGNARATPQRGVAPPHPLGDVVAHGLFDPAGDLILGLERKTGVNRRRLPGDYGPTLLLDPREERVHRVLELLDPLGQELVGDLLHVDPGVGQGGQGRCRIGLGRRPGDLEMVRAGVQGGHRHRVDGVGPDELLDVLGVRVGGILGSGGRPQWALHGRAAVAQGLPAPAREDLLKAPIRGARIGDGGGPGQITTTELLELLVGLGVDPRDEERGHRANVQGQSLGLAALEPLDVGLGDRLVGLDREQQRDVDVYSLVDRLLDRRHAVRGAGDLDHQVGTLDPPPVIPGHGQRALCVVGDVGCDLERDEAVLAAALLVDSGEHVAGQLDIALGELRIDLQGLESLARELLQVLVVVVGPQDRLLKDRRVGSDAAQRLLLHHPRELPALHEGPADLVQPDADARAREPGQPFVDLRSGAHRANSSLPSSATRTAVIPKCS